MIYKINNIMFLNSRNIMIARLLKKLNDKMLESFKILTEIKHAYQLKLSSTIKIHSKFILNLLQLNSKDLLKEQQNESFDFIVINDEDEWKVKNILNFRHYKKNCNIMLIEKIITSIYINTMLMKMSLKTT